MPGRRVIWIAVAGTLCAVSSPVVLAATPLAVWRAYRALRRGNWKMVALATALLGGAAIQASFNLAFLHNARHAAAPLVPNLPLALLFQGALRVLLGYGPAKMLAEHYMWPVAIGASLLIATWLVVLWRRLQVSTLLAAFPLIVGPIVMAILARRLLWATWTALPEWGGERYFLLPVCSFIFLVAAGVDTFPRSWFSFVALLLPFALGTALNFRVPPCRDYNWQGQAYLVRQWVATGCRVTIPIPPGLPWAVSLPNLAPEGAGWCGSSLWLRAKVAAAGQVGPVIPISAWKADPTWTRNGFHPSVGTLPGEVLYGSYSGADANVGTMVSAPFSAHPPGCIVLPIAHGPFIEGQSVRLVAADNGEDLGSVRLDLDAGPWLYWAVYFSREVPMLRIVAEDRGNQFGQWVAVGEPHDCR